MCRQIKVHLLLIHFIIHFPFISTIVGVVCKDGIILGAEKVLRSKLLLAKTDQRLYNVDEHVGMAIGGKIPDSRNVMLRARSEAETYAK